MLKVRTFKELVFCPSPIILAIAGFLEIPMLLIFSQPNTLEMAGFFIPLFFVTIGIFLAVFYWFAVKIFKRELPGLFYIFLLGLLVWELGVAVAV